MAFLRDIITLFENRNISVAIDPALLPEIKSDDKVTTPRNISFNIYRLIYHIGVIQSRRFATSNRLKFLDKTDLIEKIYNDTEQFRIKISEIRHLNGSETLISISEDFGAGISVVIAESLFNIKRSTIQKIYGTHSRPDWNCQLIDNRILVVEAKGSTSIQTSRTQEIDALLQKSQEPGDILIASLTVLNENAISTNRFLDPPSERNENRPVMENHILRAGHYASVFSFLGNSKLSIYYSQMRKRLEGLITPEEQDSKDQTFRDLNLNAPEVHFQDKVFVGSFYNVEDHKYLFVGVDKNLLSYMGFINFIDYESDAEEDQFENHYVLYKDGVLLIEINNIAYFSNIINIDEIPNYQDNITISDIDEMNEISFSKYFIYLLRKNGFREIRQEVKISNNFRVDLIAIRNEVNYFFEFKIYKSKRISTDTLNQLSRLSTEIKNGRFVLVTNAKLDYRRSNFNFSIIERSKLNELIKDGSLLIELINS